MMYKVLKADGSIVECYGDIKDDSNFSVVCDDEWDDDFWLGGNLVTGKPFTSWEEVVSTLQMYFESDIVEITAV